MPPSPVIFGSRSRSSSAFKPLALDTVRRRAFPQGAHPFHFEFGRGDQHLAAVVVANAVLIAKGFGGAVSRQAKLRLQAAGRVIDPGMDHAAVVARLVTGRAGLFFQQRNAGVRIDINQLHGGRHADDAAANNHKIIHPLNSFALTDASGSG